MSHPEINQLIRAEELFDAGKLDEALEIFNDRSQFEDLTAQQKDHYQFLKGLILVYQNKSEEVIKLGEAIFEEAQKFNDNLKSLDGLFFIHTGLCIVEKYDEALKFIEKAEDLLRDIPNLPKIIFKKREARINLLKGTIYLGPNDTDLAEKYLESTLDSQKILGDTFDLAWAHMKMMQIMFMINNRVDIAREHLKKLLSHAKEIKFNHYWIAVYHGYSATICEAIGELDQCLTHYMKGAKLIEGFKSKFWNAALFNNIGLMYCQKGEFDLALKYLEESLVLWEHVPFQIENCLDSLIFVALEKGDVEYAQKYFQRLENMYNHKKDPNLELIYQYNKALFLKMSSRIRDKAKAEELLKQVIETKTLSYDLIIHAHIHLCDLLLAEFRHNNNGELLDEINHHIAQLLTTAEKSHSYPVFCESFILQAKLTLINFNFKAARRFLTQAQKIVESHGIKRLAMKISHEHDKLLKELSIWENLKKTDASLSERWRIAGLNGQMEIMMRRQMIEVPKLSEEEPVTIFIITEGGTPLLSHSFIEEKTHESHLFGGFLTTIDYFIREMFSEGLDRASFGKYTLLMKSIPHFFVSYIYKGDSYYALQKIKDFIDHLQKEGDIWENLIRYFKNNQQIKLKDFPLLESLVTEIFINRSIVYSEF